MPWNVGSVAGRNGQQTNGLSCPDPTPTSRSPVHCPSGLRSKAEISPPGTPLQKVFMLHRPQEDTFHGVTAPSAHTVLSFSPVSWRLLCSRHGSESFSGHLVLSVATRRGYSESCHTVEEPGLSLAAINSQDP